MVLCDVSFLQAISQVHTAGLTWVEHGIVTHKSDDSSARLLLLLYNLVV